MKWFHKNDDATPAGIFDPGGFTGISRLAADGGSRTGRKADSFEDGVGTGGSENVYLGLAVSAARLRVVFACIALFLFVIIGQSAHVQVAQGAHYAERAELNRSRIEPVPSERGIVFDRNHVVLSKNLPYFTVQITPADLPKKAADRLQVIGRLAEILELQPTDIDSAIEEFRGYALAVPVAVDLRHDQAVLLTAEVDELTGVTLVQTTRREYPLTVETSSFSHLLGFQGRVAKADLEKGGGDGYIPTDFIGKTGIERSYETVLRGSYGKRRVEIDASGRTKSIIAEESGVPGNDLELSIDAALQKEVERVLLGRMRYSGKTRGSAIVMNPMTGEILALVSVPAFDNNRFARGISTEDYRTLSENKDNPLFPRAIAGLLPPGSTFKPAVAAAALEEGTVTPATLVRSSGGIRYGAWWFPDWKGGGHGLTNVTKAIAESVNTYFYTIGGGYGDIKGLGPEKIDEYAAKFGFGQALGIDLPSEADGFLPTVEWKERTKNEPWYIGDTYHMAIGQGDILATPLQIAEMTAVFANGGQLITPRVVRAFMSKDGRRTELPPEVVNPQVVSSSTVQAVQQGMRQTVTAGSARSLGDLPIAVAGKTGTAQWHSKKPNHAWFTSFAPFEKPEIVVTVVVEEGGEGSSISAPIAKDIYAWYFRDRYPKPLPPPEPIPDEPEAAPATTEETPVEAAVDAGV